MEFPFDINHNYHVFAITTSCGPIMPLDLYHYNYNNNNYYYYWGDVVVINNRPSEYIPLLQWMGSSFEITAIPPGAH